MKITSKKVVYDLELGNEVEITADHLKMLAGFHNTVIERGLLTASILHNIKSTQAYLAVDGISSWTEYLKSEYTQISIRTAFYYLKIYEVFGNWFPGLRLEDGSLHPVHLLDKIAFKYLKKGVEEKSLRIYYNFEDAQLNEQWDIISRTALKALYLIANYVSSSKDEGKENLFVEQFGYLAPHQLTNGQTLIPQELPKLSVSQVKEILEPPVIIEPIRLPEKQSKYSPAEKEVVSCIQNGLRYLGQLKNEVSRIKASKEVLDKYRQELKQLAKEAEQLSEYLAKEDNLLVEDAPPLADEAFQTLDELSTQLGITSRHLLKLIPTITPSCVKTKTSAGRGGKQYLINPSGLPADYRERLKDQDDEVDVQAHEANVLARLSEQQRQKTLMWLELIKLFGGLKGEKQISAAIDNYNRESTTYDNITTKTFYRKRKLYNDNGIEGIVGDYGKNAGRSKIDDRDYDRFKQQYLQESCPSIMDSWKVVVGMAQKEGRIRVDQVTEAIIEIDPRSGEDIQTFPARDTFFYQLKKEKGQGKIDRIRQGDYRTRQTATHKSIRRDYSNIKANQGWCSDHRTIDVICRSNEDPTPRLMITAYKESLKAGGYLKLEPKIRRAIEAELTGKRYKRLWLTAWTDIKTGKFLSYYLHEEAPNSNHIFKSFADAVRQYGLPEFILIDNGKDYRSLDFAGGRFKESKHRRTLEDDNYRSLMRNLGIDVWFAKPYNSDGKPIERMFQYLMPLERQQPTYTGSDPKQRPEACLQNIKKGNVPDALDFIELYSRFIETVNNEPRHGDVHGGKSANRLWEEENPVIRKVSDEALELFSYRQLPTRELRGNGYLSPASSQYYWGDWMSANIGTKVFAKIKPEDPFKALIFDDSTGKYLGDAKMTVPVAFRASTDEEKEQLNKALAEQRAYETSMKMVGIKKAVGDDIDYLEAHAHYVEVANEIQDARFGELQQSGRIIQPAKTQLDKLASSIANQNRRGNLDMSAIVPTQTPKRKLKALKSDED